MRRLKKIQKFCAKCSNFLLVYLLLGHEILQFSTISALAHSKDSNSSPGDGMSLKSRELSSEQLEDFKRTFLTKIGLQSRIKRHLREENAAQKPPLEVPEYLWDIYDRIVEENGEEFENGENEVFLGSGANTIRNIFADSADLYPMEGGGNGAILSFNLTRIPGEETFTEAELRLQIVRHRDRHVRISISEILDSCSGIVNLLDTKIVPNDGGFEGNSVIFDVLPAIVRTLSQRNRTLNFLVDVRNAQNQPVQNISNWVSFPADSADDSASNSVSQPAALLLYSTDSQGAGNGASERRRTKRGTGRRGKKRRGGRRRHGKKKLRHRRNLCKKRGLYVDFRELNWQDWILAPTGYEAHFCSGACEYPIVDAQNTTNHAIVQSLVNSVSPGAVPPPCCVPTEMSAISMLYIDIDNRIVIKNYPEMIVEGCGCR